MGSCENKSKKGQAKNQKRANQNDPASNSKYFWWSDPDPFSSEKNATWQAYAAEDNILLEEAYQNFLLLNKAFHTIAKKANNYIADFSTWCQYSIKESNNQRPFKRVSCQEEVQETSI